MKKIIQFFFVFFLFVVLSINIIAQELKPFGLAPHMGRVKQPQYEKSGEPETLYTGYGTDAIGFGYPFVSMPIPDGTPWIVLNSSNSIWLAGADMDQTTGLYYGCSYEGGLGVSNLVNVDLNTGAATIIAPITGISQYPVALAYSNSTNTWYYGETDGTTSRLYTINIATGVATFVGTIFNGQLIAIAIDCYGFAYGEEMITDQLYSIDLTTGVGTAIGYMGFNCTYAQDADFDASTGILYLASYDSNTGTAALKTCDTNTGATTVVVSWPGSEITGFAIDNWCWCPVGQPINPYPPNGMTNVSISGETLSWVNGTNTVDVEVWFGPSGNLTKVYDGTAITSWSTGPLEYSTTYRWRIRCKGSYCGVWGPTWMFTTELDPNLVQWCDYFGDFNNWTWIGPLGQTNWSIVSDNTAGGIAPELQMFWSPSFVGVSTVRSEVIPDFPNNVSVDYYFRFYLDWYADPSGEVTVGVTFDGGTTVNNLYTVTDPTGSVGPLELSGSFPTPANGSENLQIEITYNGDSFNINWISLDDMCLEYIIPVELTSFTAISNGMDVQLNWTTATETNNQGFEVQRSPSLIPSQREGISQTTLWEDWGPIGFVEGNGTTTETNTYSYTDNNLKSGKYNYRLKQIDFDGSYEYSNVVEVNVITPVVYALEQNYPNPFNPSTTINFRLAVDSKVNLKVFDVLGQEVATLLNGNLVAGSHTVNFNASSLNSGVYMYRIEANGVDGSNFSQARKMVLTK